MIILKSYIFDFLCPNYDLTRFFSKLSIFVRLNDMEMFIAKLEIRLHY